MKQIKIFEVTKSELLEIFQSWYNKNNSTNHSFVTGDLPEVVQFELSMWDKDEKGH